MERISDEIKAQKWLESLDWDNIPDADDNLATICEALQYTEKYRDLEEKGLLVKLPCAVVDNVYKIVKIPDYGEFGDKAEFIYRIDEVKFDYEMIPLFGKSVFLAKEQAEQVLRVSKANN